MASSAADFTAGGATSAAAEDGRSEFGDLFSQPESAPSAAASTVRASRSSAPGNSRFPVNVEGQTRVQATTAMGFGKGPVRGDPRKFRYDQTRARTLPAVSWTASKVDRMDPTEAGDTLDAIHCMFGIEREREDRIKAFDDALWYQHTVNGASQLQPGRGQIVVDGQAFDIGEIVKKLGENARRFFRAFADDIAAGNRAILDAYDPYDEDSREKVGNIRAVAEARGLRKFPHFAHDSSSACIEMSMEERNAVLVAKRYYLPQTVNQVDALPPAAVAEGRE